MDGVVDGEDYYHVVAIAETFEDFFFCSQLWLVTVRAAWDVFLIFFKRCVFFTKLPLTSSGITAREPPF